MSRSSSESPMDNVILATDDGNLPAGSEDEKPVSPWCALCSCAGMKYVIIAVGLALAQQLTGINAIMFYGPQIFELAGVPESKILLVTMAAIGTWNLLAVFISFALVDRLGRRPLMLGALLAMLVATLVSGIAYTVPGLSVTVKSVLLIAMTMLFIGGFETGPGPLFFVMASESFSPLIKSEGLVLCNALAWTFNIALVFLFPLANDSIGPGPTQFILTGTCLTALAIIYFRVPETKAVNEEADKDAAVAEAAEAGDELKVELTIRTRVIACFMVGILSGCLYGYQTCVVSGLTKPLMDVNTSVYNLTEAEGASIFTSIFTTEILVGGMVGSFIATPIADGAGRKIGIIVCAAIGLVPSITLSLIANYWVAVVSRTVQGVAVGMSCVVAPLYVNEVAPIKRRGSLGTLFQVSICSSILLAELLNFLLQPDPTTEVFAHPWYWKVQFAGGALFAGLLLLYGIFFMPESEMWVARTAAQKRRRQMSSASAAGALLADDHMGSLEGGGGGGGGGGTAGAQGAGMGSRTPSKAELLETPRGMEWKSAKSWGDVRNAAGGMAAAIKRSFNDLRNLDAKDGGGGSGGNDTAEGE